MKPPRPGILFAILALVTLLISACQPAVLTTPKPPADPAGTAVQPLETATEVPASTPPVAVTRAAPTSEGSALPLTGGQVPDGWQVINDSTRGYSLAYTTKWEICQETKYSRLFCEIQKEPVGMGPPPRLYVSAFPTEYTNPDWEVYNFTPAATIRQFLALPVGASMLKEPGSPTPDHFTYTRLPDQVFAGQTGLVIENSKVWEMPSGTRDRVIFLSDGGTTYILGMYYETPEQLAMFEQVLDSFQPVP
jgi:hypothetical protein